MKYENTGVFHYFIYVKLKEKIDNPGSNMIKRSEVKKVLYNNHIPIVLHQKFLREMEGFGLVKLKNKQNIRILKNR